MSDYKQILIKGEYIMNFLNVKNSKIIDSKGNEVFLRGVCLGGWMNMENFITGYTGSESSLRKTCKEILGEKKYLFLFNRLLDYFITEDDISFIKSCNATAIRVPFNYRHFEDDAKPFFWLKEGFKRLDRILKLAEKYSLYVILDFHAVQGCQNHGWHSDNPDHVNYFWQHPHFQDRFISLWEEIASYYAKNPVVAGYDIMNEPSSSNPYLINKIYKRTIKAIRKKDKKHIIFIEGDNYSGSFNKLEDLSGTNIAMSSHIYPPPCLQNFKYPGTFEGKLWNRDSLEDLVIKSEAFKYHKKTKMPWWIGEFGVSFNSNQKEIPSRLKALDDLLGIFNERKLHWTYWTYKDVGVMGWVMTSPESKYIKLLKPLLKAKEYFRTDLWMDWLPDTKPVFLVKEIFDEIKKVLPDFKIEGEYWERKNLQEATLCNHLGKLFQRYFAYLFKDKKEDEIEDILQSFHFKECVINKELITVIKKHQYLEFEIL